MVGWQACLDWQACLVGALALGVLFLLLQRRAAAQRRARRWFAQLRGEEGDRQLFAGALRELALPELVRRRGRTFRFYPCAGPVQGMFGPGADGILATADAEAVHAVLCTKVHSDRRHPRYVAASQLVPGLDGILFQEGERWKQHTRVLLPGFHGASFERFSSAFHRSMCWLTARPGWQQQQELDLLQELRAVSRSFLCEAGYGIAPDSAEGRALIDAVAAYDERLRLEVEPYEVPLWCGGVVAGLARAHYRLKRDTAHIQEVTDRIRATFGGGVIGSSSDDDDAAAASHSAGGGGWLRAMHDAGFSGLEIANEINFADNAHKAVALLTSFCVFRLLEEARDGAGQRAAEGRAKPKCGGSSSSSWLELMRAELLAVVGGEGPVRADAARLPITMAVWKETLRLHPAALAVLRMTGSPVLASTASPPLAASAAASSTFQTSVRNPSAGAGEAGEEAVSPAGARGTSVTVPAGQEVILMVYAMHTDADYWGAAPHSFRPGRWLPAPHPCGRGCHVAKRLGKAVGAHPAEEEGDLSPRSTLSDIGVKGAFVPFLDGQRQCQGRFLAELEFMVMMHAMLTRFELRLAQPDFSLTLKPDMYPTLAEPIRIVATPRRGAEPKKDK